VTIWIDAQLSPDLASWLHNTFSITAVAVRDLGLRDASDAQIFQAAQVGNVVVLTKDAVPAGGWGCAGGRTGPHKGHSVNEGRENPVWTKPLARRTLRVSLARSTG
jgi:hypothetical protein